MREQVRVFVSHHRSPTEDAFTNRLVADLQTAGADVWLDTERIPSGDFVSKINEGLAGRQWLVLVMTPDAIKSTWVRAEVNAAISQVNAGRMLGVIPVVAMACDESDIPLLWANLQRYDATRDYQAAVAGLLHAFGVTSPGQAPVAAAPVPAVATPVPTVPDKKPGARQSRRRVVLSAVSILLVAVVMVTLFLSGILPNPFSQSPQDLFRQITSGRPQESDSLTSSSQSLWDVNTSCSFTQGAYSITSSQADRTSECYDNLSTYSNFLFRATVSITTGDSAGLVFRSKDATGTAPRYRFAVYQNGNYNLAYAPTQYGSSPLVSGASSRIGSGANTLAVIAKDNTMYLFINNQFVNSYTETSHSAPTLGKIGVFAYNVQSPTTTAEVSSVEVWSIT
jgi:hypothetical protein